MILGSLIYPKDMQKDVNFIALKKEYDCEDVYSMLYSFSLAKMDAIIAEQPAFKDVFNYFK